jgi:hypothetical protein
MAQARLTHARPEFGIDRVNDRRSRAFGCGAQLSLDV